MREKTIEWPKKERVLVLCTGNSARSQMAEALIRELAGDRFDVESAGSMPSKVHPGAIRVMGERGLSLEGHRSKHLNEFLQTSFTHVITVCDNAAHACPVFPGAARRWHWPFTDPASIDQADEQLATFRSVRDEIELRVSTWLAEELDDS